MFSCSRLLLTFNFLANFVSKFSLFDSSEAILIPVDGPIEGDGVLGKVFESDFGRGHKIV
jgi:hypothetical protein